MRVMLRGMSSDEWSFRGGWVVRDDACLVRKGESSDEGERGQ